MAKKSRRARRRRATRGAVKRGAVSKPEDRTEVEVAAGPRPATSGFTEQYAYVYDDLKRIAILAGTLFAVLIALSFLIQ